MALPTHKGSVKSTCTPRWTTWPRCKNDISRFRMHISWRELCLFSAFSFLALEFCFFLLQNSEKWSKINYSLCFFFSQKLHCSSHYLRMLAQLYSFYMSPARFHQKRKAVKQRRPCEGFMNVPEKFLGFPPIESVPLCPSNTFYVLLLLSRTMTITFYLENPSISEGRFNHNFLWNIHAHA